MKTAYIELNTTNQIRCLSKAHNKRVFSYKGIDFYPNTSLTSLGEILHKDYRYFVLDMGVLNTYTTKEFQRCDELFLICSPSKWRLPLAKEKIETLLKNVMSQNHVTVIMNLCEKKSKVLRLSFAHRCVAFPFIPNPFQLETSMFHALYRIFRI